VNTQDLIALTDKIIASVPIYGDGVESMAYRTRLVQAALAAAPKKADERGSAEPIYDGMSREDVQEHLSQLSVEDLRLLVTGLLIEKQALKDRCEALARDGSEPGPYVENWREPHPASRLCMCPACAPSFDDRFEPPPEQRAEPQGMTPSDVFRLWNEAVNRNELTADIVQDFAVMLLAARASAGRAKPCK
jgi:hypothetical protein